MAGPTHRVSGSLEVVIEQILQADRHLKVDQVEQARDIYERVVALDPSNAIAVVGLARCALADGDDRRAHELASQALAIDPENDMARRMEARLAEILTARGETVERPEAAETRGTAEMRPIVTADSRASLSTADASQPDPAAARGESDVSTPAEADAASLASSATQASPISQAPSATPAAHPRRSLLERLRGR